MRRVPLVLLTMLAAVLPAPPAAGLDPRRAPTQYSHQAWSSDDGLPQRSVQAILQTRDGYLWLGTQEGLVRFDGVRFRVFDKRDVPGLRNNNVQAIAEGRDGSLWLGTGGGGVVQRKGGAFRVVGPDQGLAHGVVWALREDRNGRLWIGTAGGGLYRWDGARAVRFGGREGLGSEHVLALHEDRAGALWIGTDGGGAARLAGGRLERFTRREGLPSDTVYAFAEEKDGTLWIGTAAGLSRRKDGVFTSFGRREGLAAERVEALLLDREGSLWLGTYGGGLLRREASGFSAFASQDGLSNDMVKALYEDQEGSLWIGTRTGGLNRLKAGRVLVISAPEGLSHDFVWSVLEDRAGRLWIGTDGGGLNCLQDGRIRVFTREGGLGHAAVRSLAEDTAGRLWIGTNGGGLVLLEGGRFRTYSRRDGLPHEFVRALLADRDGSVWIGTYGGGLAHLKDGVFRTYTTRDGLGSDVVYALMQSRDGELWVGTRGGGLSRLRDGRITTYGAKDGLSDEVVLALHEDASGAIWIGTTGGLNRLQGGRFRSAGVKDGLPDDVAYRILEDDAGRLWMSSNKGLYAVSRRQLEELLERRRRSLDAVVHYGRADGMKSAECNGGISPAGWRRRDGRLCFPTIRGLAIVDPREERINRRPPPVVVDEVAVDGRGYDPGQPVLAPPGRGELHLRYAGLSFLAPEKLRFRRKLEGFDADWVEAGSAREAEYTNLPPGRYSFRVVAANEDGVWNESGATLELHLEPRLRQTWWFRTALALALLGGAWTAYGLRVRRLTRRQRRLQALVEERTRDLAQTASHLEQTNRGLHEAVRLKDEVVSIVAHDFRAPLGVIAEQARRLEASAEDETSQRLLGIVSAQVRHLASLAEDTLTLSRIETGTLPLQLQEVRIGDLARAIVDARGSSPGVELALDAPDPGAMVRGDPDRLYQVIDNLVGNAVKYSPDGARVRVRVVRQDREVQVSVSDRGLGIPPEEMGKLFRKFSRLDGARHRRISGTGLGLYICRSIVEAHGGRIWAESRPGEGSTFHVSLPLAPGTAA